jgi:tetratricopeptide (TPR) repeat protein
MRPSLTVLVFLLALPGALFARSKPELIYAFRNHQATAPIKMILVGEIKSKIKAAEIYDKDSPFRDYDTRLDQVTVRVVNREGIKPGQKLYVIDKNPHHEKYRNGLIVGEIVVESILNNPFYGLVLTGKGILLRVREGQFVARTQESENLEKALRIKKRGDALRSRGEISQAMAEYLKSIAADRELADAHAALADLYSEEARSSGEYPVRALSHYRQAFKHRQNFDTQLDRYRFYVNYLRTLRMARKQRENVYADESKPPAELLDAMQPAEECMKMSSHPDCRIEAACAFYEMMSFHAGRSGAGHRREYDAYREKTGLLLKELSEQVFRRSMEVKDRTDYESGLPEFGDASVARSDYHRLAVLYYDVLLRESSADSDARSRLMALVREHLTAFYRSRGMHALPDPEIEAIRRRVVDVR